jgi:hypothetical protein
MDSLGSMATSGLTVTMTPAQLVVGAGVLGVVLLSNAKSLMFMWHVKRPANYIVASVLIPPIGTTLLATCTASPIVEICLHSKMRKTGRRGPLRAGRDLVLYPNARH